MLKIDVLKRTKLEGKLRKLQEERKMFTAQFIKIDGEVRQITAYVSPVAGIPEQDRFDYITVFDIFEQDFRTMNLATVEQICFDNKVYYVID